MNFKYSKELNILLNEPLLFITIPIASFILFFLFLLKRIILFRFGFLHSDRIGHFALNTELWLCEKKNINKSKLIFDFFYIPTKICNNQLYIMWKRHFTFLPKILLRPFCLLVRKFSFLKDHIAGVTISGDYDKDNLLDKYNSQIYFTDYEISEGNKQLNKLGIPLNQKYICLIVRDESYLKANNPKLEHKHSHRNFDIEDFKMVSEYLVKQGYYVIRMGSVVKSKISFSSDRIIDYANSNNQNDFMDIFLAANCNFCISTVTGLDAIPIIFRKPVFFVGSIPIAYMLTGSKKFINSTMVHYSTILKRNLTLEEIFINKISNLFSAKDFEKLNIKLIKPSSKDITLFIANNIKYINESNITEPSNEQILFWNKFISFCKKYLPDLKIHGEVRAIFDLNYLKKNKDFLN